MLANVIGQPIFRPQLMTCHFAVVSNKSYYKEDFKLIAMKRPLPTIKSIHGKSSSSFTSIYFVFIFIFFCSDDQTS